MNITDLPEVLKIERLSFPSPWSEQSFLHELEKPYAHCYIARENSTLVAFTIAWTAADELHIANLAVHPSCRRQGIARQLIQKVLSSARYNIVCLEVRESNLPAQKLYEGLGFESVGIRRNYYKAENEDAIIMMRERAGRELEI